MEPEKPGSSGSTDSLDSMRSMDAVVDVEVGPDVVLLPAGAACTLSSKCENWICLSDDD
jgi:hypothetical protein